MKIVADSGCDYIKEFDNNGPGGGCNIEFVPFTLRLCGKEYLDDETLNIPQYIKAMGESGEGPKTAAPSPDSYAKSFRGDCVGKNEKNNGEDVFAVTISSKLSASYNNAMLAKATLMDEGFAASINVFDSLSASIAETLIALKIKELITLKKTTPVIVKETEDFIKSMNTYYILNSYENLVRNGRMQPYVARIASMLSITPICTAINGEMAIAKKVQGSKKVFPKLAEMIRSKNLDFENKILGISHVNCIEKAMELKYEITKLITFKDCVVAHTKGLSSTYADDGGLVIAY